MRTTWLLALAPPVSVLLVFVLTWGSHRREERAPGSAFWDEEVVDFVRDRVATMYVDPLPPERTTAMFYDALDAYVGSLDIYSDFLSPDEYRRWTEETAGHYAGIGIKVDATPEGLRVAGVFPGGPADRAGIRIGELIVSADGRSLAAASRTAEEIVGALKGPLGSAVRVTVAPAPSESGPGAERELTVVRDDIQQPTVHARRVGRDDRYLHLAVVDFVDTTDGELGRHLDAALADGVRGVLLDLRGNSGGILDATLRIADRFLREGDIARMVARTVGGGHVHRAVDEGTVPESVGLVVLVDWRSASASELLAGALQDHRRGVLLGTRTHGKFVVQSIVPIPGKGAALKLTTARYTTPLGRWFRRTKGPTREGGYPPEGLVPDVVVALEQDDQVRLAKSVANRDAAVWGQPPVYADVPAGWVDPQIESAVSVLDGQVVFSDLRPRRPASASRG